jgi:hypothetical protein
MTSKKGKIPDNSIYFYNLEEINAKIKLLNEYTNIYYKYITDTDLKNSLMVKKYLDTRITMEVLKELYYDIQNYHILNNVIPKKIKYDEILITPINLTDENFISLLKNNTKYSNYFKIDHDFFTSLYYHDF